MRYNNSLPNSQNKAFTLVEILSTVSIIALLVSSVIVVIPYFVAWAKQTSDKQTLTVLNEALTKFKAQGGGTAALTSGALIGNVISRLQQPVSWSGLTHQYLQSGVTYSGRSIDALGSGSSYRFTRYNTYVGETGGYSPVSSRLVAVISYSNTGYYTTNGTSWTSTTQATSGAFCAGAYGNGKFFARTSNTAYGMYSSNGINWTQITGPGFSGNGLGGAFGNGKFAIIQYYGNPYYTTDPSSWTTSSISQNKTWGWMAFGNGTFVATDTGSYTAYSTNGINWTPVALANCGPIAYGNGRFVTISYWPGSSRDVSYSSDGITWTVGSNALPAGFLSGGCPGICYGGGKFLAVAGNNSNVAAQSSDGITWTQVTLPNTNNTGAVAYFNGYYYVGQWGRMLYSSDLSTWSTNNTITPVGVFITN
jgi:type II secretory pathway pseudopilin PulG